MNRGLRTMAAATAVALSGANAIAHPHVFAEARLDVVVDAGATVRSLRHLWRFDDAFSSTVLVEFDRNGNLVLDVDELEEVGGVIHESLAEYGYFQFVTADGADVAMQAPERIVADMQDGQLIVLFESQPRQPLRLAGRLTFGIFDPTFFTAIDYTQDEWMAVENLPASCTRKVVRPDPDEAIAQNREFLTEDFLDPDQPNDYSKIFATRLELTCTGS